MAAPDDDPLGLEDDWEDLRGPRPPSEEPKRGIVWMGLGPIEGQEFSYPGYERVRTPLRLDGSDMCGEFRPPDGSLPFEEVQVTWVGLWFHRRGGQPLYESTCSTVYLGSQDVVHMNVSLTDEGGYLTRTLRALDLL